MKRLSYLYILTFLLASCQQEAAIDLEAGKGYLSLASLEVQAENVTQINTRAVDEDLAIQICSADGNSVIKEFEAGDESASKNIELEAGDYLLKAYSANHETTYGEGELGAPKYYAAEPFKIETAKVNYLTVNVPMTNFGVTLSLPDNFNELFPTYTFTVTLGSRSLTLTQGDTAYFDLPTDDSNGNASLQYTLQATNVDGEPFEQPKVYEGTLTAGTLYEISYSQATRSILLEEENEQAGRY